MNIINVSVLSVDNTNLKIHIKFGEFISQQSFIVRDKVPLNALIDFVILRLLKICNIICFFKMNKALTRFFN